MALYAFSTFLIGIVLISGLCFVMGWAWSYIAAVTQKTDIDLGVNNADTEGSYDSFNLIATWIAVAMLVALGLWALVYTQRKGGQVYGEA